MIFGSQLEAVDTCANPKATTSIAPRSFATCGAGGMPANLEPPVSATADRIYYRDGDTKIRYMTLDGQTFDATTAPGSSEVVSFFSVSPDDKRIAVLVEDASDEINLKLRLYVEDVIGGGHHADIYRTTVPMSTGNTLWPMGWHAGNLVLALIRGCSPQPEWTTPVEWHIVDPATGNRLVNITAICPPDRPGFLSRWPSPGGIGCADYRGGMQLFDWSGASFKSVGSEPASDMQSGVSPLGQHFFYGSPQFYEFCGVEPPASCIDNGQAVGTVACLFIDETHLLSPDGVVDLQGFGTLVPLKFPAPGTCAGRFPGGL